MRQQFRKLCRSATVAVTGIAVILALVVVPVGAPKAEAQTVQELQLQIQSLLSTITALQAQLAALQGGQPGAVGKPNVPTTFSFTRNLRQGSRGTDVLYLQRILNAYPSSRVANTGAGSPGNETTYFGSLTRSAVIRFQELFAAEILAPVGLTKGTGYVGPSTRAKLNALIAANFPGVGTTTPPGTTPPGTTPPGTTPPPSGAATLTITAGAQPSATLAPENAARLPFSRFTVTASNNAAVTLDGVIVERTGLGNDAVFSSIVLLDSDGIPVGLSRTLNAAHQATIGESITIPAGQSRTFTVAGNMASNLDSYAGQIVGLSVVGVNVSGGTVSGSLPITGAQHTINATFAIGTATVRTGTLGTASATREIGSTGYTFSSFILTAGSQEDVRLDSIRWNQAGSIASGDLANVVTVIDGVSYPTTVSSNGKYYISDLGNGVVIPKGQSREISIRGNIVSGSGRTIAFDIDRATDIILVGTQFNYGITPTAESTATASTATAEFTTGSPFFSSAVVTVSGASLIVSRATSVGAQNVGVQAANQTLGGFTFDVQGESITLQNLVFDVTITRASGSSAAVEDIDNVVLVNQNGTVISGPVDAVGTGTTGTITFSGAFTLQPGSNTLTLRGLLGSDFDDDDRIVISLTPSADITNARGDVSGNTITASPSAEITASTITVAGIDLNATVSPTPAAQTVVAGAQNFTFARFQFDATGSGEDIRLNSIPVQFTHSGSPENLSNCRIFNAGTTATSTATQLTSGSNILNPSSSFTSGNTTTFTLDTSLVIPRGQITTLEVRCDISASASAGETFSFGLSTAPTGFGLQSGQTVTADVTASAGQTMTIAGAGTFTVTESPASPSYQIAASGDNRIVAVLRFQASNESVDINQLGLQLTGSSASSSPADITALTLWDGNSQVGSALFLGNQRHATTTLTSDFVVPQNTHRDLTIRATFGEIGPNQAATEGAFIKVDYDGDNASTTEGIGLASGTRLTSASTADTDTEGVRMFNTIPTVARDNTPSTILVSGEQSLMRFRIAADDNDAVGLYKFTLTFATSTANVTNVNVFAFTDASYTSAASGVSTGGQLMVSNQSPNSSGVVEIYAQNASGTNVPLQVPAGATRYFDVRGTVTGATTGSVVTVTLEGDSAHPALATLMGTAAEIDADANDDFIWSPNATTTSTVTHRDWTNGYGVPGLPANGLTSTIAR